MAPNVTNPKAPINQLIDALGITQAELARWLGISRQRISTLARKEQLLPKQHNAKILEIARNPDEIALYLRRS
jgi:predicted XRE-type DNA-binding protein